MLYVVRSFIRCWKMAWVTLDFAHAFAITLIMLNNFVVLRSYLYVYERNFLTTHNFIYSFLTFLSTLNIVRREEL